MNEANDFILETEELARHFDRGGDRDPEGNPIGAGVCHGARQARRCYRLGRPLSQTEGSARVSSFIQFVSQLAPPSVEKACSQRR